MIFVMTEKYFNYFTEVEEHFRAVRGDGLFMLSPRDWTLLEAWRKAGTPLEAVLRGIDAAFKRLRRRARMQSINSLYYCRYAVAEEAQAMANAAPIARKSIEPTFSIEDVRGFVGKNTIALRAAGHGDLAAALASLDLDALPSDLEELEQLLSSIEGRLITRLRDGASAAQLLDVRRDLDRDLRPYRGKMTAGQIAVLEKQFLERRLLELAGLSRLGLLYL